MSRQIIIKYYVEFVWVFLKNNLRKIQAVEINKNRIEIQLPTRSKYNVIYSHVFNII